MTNCKLHPAVEEYLVMVEKKQIRSCKEQKMLCKHVRKAFREEKIYTDAELYDNYMRMEKYFSFTLFPWEKFVFALNLCTFREDGLPRWPDLFLLLGRGAGKDGYIGFQSSALASPYNPAKRYDIDICANSELQARAPFDDFHEVLEGNHRKLVKHFYWNKEEIVGLKSRAKIKYRTNNPKGKDGLRSGQVVFNEIHQYENYDNINVFTTGLGKKEHPRRLYATTNGDVRDGPLDHYIEKSKAILDGAEPDNGWLPFICKLDNKKEVHDPDNWEKANPSLPYNPQLREEIAKEYIDWKAAPSQFTAFITKRMNIPDGSPESEVATWDNIKRGSRDIPNLEGADAVFGIDYASLGDMAAIGILLKDGETRYWKTHSWLNLRSKDIPRIKAPWREWANDGLLTVVDDAEIHPELLMAWLDEQAKEYNILKGALDLYRYSLVKSALTASGFTDETKRLKLIRPSNLILVAPVIDSLFKNGNIVYGDNPLMRWAINNTCIRNKKEDTQAGNMRYGKIEARSRKNDPFMAFAAAMTLDGELTSGSADINDLPPPWIF